MFVAYKLKRGETFATVMKKNKITDWKGIWDLPENKALKSKRKHADKVSEGDVLTILDPRARITVIDYKGKRYVIPEGDMSAVRKEVTKQMLKKFMAPIIAQKKIYDDDYQYMFDIANGHGATIGMMAGLLESATGARLPTAEMNEVSKRIKALDKTIRSERFGNMAAAASAAEVSMKLYATASERYRKKMTNGATKGVKALEFTRDGCLDLAAVLATGMIVTAGRGRISVAEARTAVGAAKGFVKAASTEVGNQLAQENRSAEQIKESLILGTFKGAASGLIAGSVKSPVGGYVLSNTFKGTTDSAIDSVATLLKSGSLAKHVGVEVLEGLSEREIIAITARVLVTTGKGSLKAGLTEALDGGALEKAFKISIVSSGGDLSKLASSMTKSLLADGLADRIVAGAIKKHRKDIHAALSKAKKVAA